MPVTTPSTVFTPEPSVLVDEDFSAGVLPDGWRPILGDWKVVDGRLQATTDKARARILFGPDVPESFRIQALVRFVDVVDARRWLNIGVDYHVSEDWGAVFVVRNDTTQPDGLELAQKAGPDERFYSDPVAAAPAAVGVGQDHWFSVEVHGNSLTAEMDGVPVFSANNVSRTGGQFGFVIHQSTVQFDNVRIIRLDA